MLEGLTQLTDTLRGLPPTLRSASEDYLDEAGASIARRAAELAPRDTGALAASIGCQRTGLDADIGPAVGVSRFDPSDLTFHVPDTYAETVEFGDETQQPEPFLRPALDEYAARAEGDAAAIVDAALR